MRFSRARWIATLAALGLLTAGAFHARSSLGLEWTLESVREVVAGFGIWGPLVFVLLLTFRMLLLLPSKLLLLVAGVCFGAFEGMVYGALGVTLSGVFLFALVRFVGAEGLGFALPEIARRHLRSLGTRGGAALMGLATGYPIGPLSIYHMGAALTTMSFAAFLVALSLGSLARAGVYAYFGNALVDGGIREIAAASAIVVAAALPLLHPGVRRFVRRQFEPQPAPVESQRQASIGR